MGVGPEWGGRGEADRNGFKLCSKGEANRLCWKIGRQKNPKDWGCRAPWIKLVFTEREKLEGRDIQREGGRHWGFSFGDINLEKVVGHVGGDEAQSWGQVEMWTKPLSASVDLANLKVESIYVWVLSHFFLSPYSHILPLPPRNTPSELSCPKATNQVFLEHWYGN